MAEHEHGSMDTKDQEKTFGTFMSWVTNGTIVILVLFVLLAIFAI
ncbi:MAG: aa3-type cytochrome c oxidase subunit IV [Pseudomonadota bacterium]